MNEYKWTREDIVNAHRKAAIAREEWIGLRAAAASIESEFWQSYLSERFPDLKYSMTSTPFLAVVSFSEGEEECLVRGPVSGRLGRSTEMLVWRKTTRGKWCKYADGWKCDEIVPFIKSAKLAPKESPEKAK